MRCGEGCAIECPFWHCHGLMKCQDETVSTVVCMCHFISLHVYKTQHAPSTLDKKHGPHVDSSTAHQGCKRVGFTTSKAKQIENKSTITTTYGRPQQRNCVQLKHGQQSCTNRPLSRTAIVEPPLSSEPS